jgi:unsaturated rhamnogalacturonyl hydrolase
VTGASRGLGAAIAVGLAGDLADSRTPARLVEEAIAALFGLDILVNNAGTIRRAPAEDTSDEDWDAVLDVNLTSVFRLSRAAGRHMLARGHGKIVNVASLLSFQGGIRVPAYAAAKSGLAALTKALANEWAGREVNVNAPRPGVHEDRQHGGASERSGAQPPDSGAHTGRSLGRARGSRGGSGLPRFARLRLCPWPRPRRGRRLDGSLMRLHRSLVPALPGAFVALLSCASFARAASPAETSKVAARPVRPLAVRLADSVLSRWPDPSGIGNRGWEYNSGIVLAGIAEVYRHTRDPRYLDYIRRYVDTYLRPDGGLDLGDDSGGHNLDRVQPGVLVLFLYEETRDEKYAKTARWLRGRFDTFPRNAVGGFWHKQKYPNEMWLDGIYMAEPFLVGYGALFGEPKFCFETAVAQATLVGAHTRVPGTGLFRHAWDEDRNAAWADPATGISPEVWSRAMGWYVMALVDILEKLPVDQPGRSKLRELLREAAGGIRSTQDPKTGLWFQVMDKAERPGNWLETSASGMFVYALKRSVDRGDLDAGLLATAKKGWTGLLSRVTVDSEGRPVVEGTVEGISVQKDFAGYVGKRRLANTPHGLCGLLFASSAMEWPDTCAPAGRAPGNRRR